MNVSLTPKLEEFIREKVSFGLYNNASEMVREALRLLVKQANTSIDTFLATPLTKSQIHKQIMSLEKPLRDKGVKSIFLFGSAVRNENTSASDVGVFIDTEPGFPSAYLI